MAVNSSICSDERPLFLDDVALGSEEIEVEVEVRAVVTLKGDIDEKEAEEVDETVVEKTVEVKVLIVEGREVAEWIVVVVVLVVVDCLVVVCSEESATVGSGVVEVAATEENVDIALVVAKTVLLELEDTEQIAFTSWLSKTMPKSVEEATVTP